VIGKDTRIYDSSGNCMFDFESGIWCTALGHSNPRINSKIIEQINKVIHLNHSFVSQHAENLAKNLLKILSMENGKAVFLSSGSEAVLLAIRLVQLIKNGGKYLTFQTSYLSANRVLNGTLSSNGITLE